MLNYVNRVLVGKASGAANTGTDLSSIAASDLLLVNADNHAIITTAADAAAAKAVYVAQGTERAGYPLLSAKIVRSKIKHFTEQVHAAKVEQVSTLDFAQATAGKNLRVSILFQDDLRLIANKQTVIRVDQKTTTTNFSVAAEVTKLAAKINGNPALSSYVGASASGSVLTITGKPVFSNSVLDKYTFVSFDATAVEVDPTGSFGQGIAYPSAVTQVASAGQGLGVQVLEQERVASGYNGNTDLRSFDRNQQSLFASAATNYDLYHITHSLESQGDMQDLTEHPLQTTVAVATNSTQGNAIQALLEAFISGLAAAAPAGE